MKIVREVIFLGTPSKYNPNFYEDLVDAVEWYNEMQIGLVERFFKQVKKQTATLSTSATNTKNEKIRIL